MDKWEEHDTYWLSKAKQGSPEWLALRLCRVTGSRVGSFVGHSRFCSIDKCVRELTGLLNMFFSDRSRRLMNNGILGEPHARKWYSEHIDKEIKQAGLAIPKWDFSLGASVDGIIDKDNICEIKVPAKMYQPLIDHREALSDKKFPKYYHDHIWETHYDQMQLGMAVLGAKNCHYIVYFPKEDDITMPEDVYYEIIPFNKKYWKQLYEHIGNNYEEHVTPLMEEYSIERTDPS